MGNITGITVRYARKVQPKQYESADAEVALTVTFEDGEADGSLENQIQAHMAIARGQVEQTLGLKSAAAPAPAKAEKPAPAKKAEKPTPAPAAEAPAKRVDPFAKSASAPKAEEPAEQKINLKTLQNACAQASQRLMSAGKGIDELTAKIRAYLPDDKTPYTYTRIPESSWSDFLSDVDKLGR